jgi:RHS repeat-associated protein
VPLTPSGSGGFSYSTALALDGSADGVHTILFTATDASGAVGTTTLTFTLQTQTIAGLSLAIAAPLPGDLVSDTGRLVGSAGSGATQASYTLDGGASLPLTLGNGGTFDQAISSSTLSAGAHTVLVTASNASGQSVQQSISFTVSTTAFTIGAAGTTGWAEQSATSAELADETSLVVQSSMAIALGQSKGSRTLSFSVAPNWDATDKTTATGDVFEALLVNPASPTQTLLSSGGSGTALFILPQDGAPQYLPGLVSFNGSQVTIDLTGLASQTSGTLVFQLLGDGSGTGSSVSVSGISDTTNPTGSAAPVYRAGADLIDAAGGAISGTLSAATGVVALLGNERFDANTGSYVAELRVKNTGSALVSQQIAVAFPGLASGVTLAAPSGTTGSGAAPYVSMVGAIPSGGLAAGATSDAVLVTFSDPTLVRFALAPEVLAGASPQLPVLAPVSPITIAPGGFDAIALQASDADGGAIAYSVSGGALPTGTLEANGTLILQPSPADVGTYNFTVTASDGAASTSEPVSVTVAGSPGSSTTLSGVVDSSSGGPIAGVPVSLGSLSTTTNSKGVYSFTYSGSAPDTSVVVHGDEMSGATTYEGLSVPIDQLTNEPIYPGYTNVVGRPTYLTPVDASSAVTVNPKSTVTVTCASNPEVVLTIPAGSLYDQTGKLYSGKVAVTVVPVDATPEPLTAGMNPPMAVMITAVGSPGTSLYLAKGTLTLPNTAGYQPGSTVNLDSPGAGGKPVVIAQGTVSSDGKTITFTALKTKPLSATAPPPDPTVMVDPFANIYESPDSASVTGSSTCSCSCPCGIPGPVSDGGGGMYSSAGDVQAPTDPAAPVQTGYAQATDAPTPDNQPVDPQAPYDGSESQDGASQNGNDPSPFSQLIPINKPQEANGKGALQQQLPVGQYSSMGVSKDLVLSYNSLDAHPINPINLTYHVNGSTAGLTDPKLTANVSIQDGSFTENLPGGSSGQYQAGQGLQYYSMPSTTTASIGVAANTSNLPTGVYKYTASVGTAQANNSALSGTAFSTSGTIFVDNSQNSPFGSGWELAGWEQVIPSPNGSALLIDGDGSRQLFRAPAAPGGAYGPPPGDNSTLISIANGWQRTMPDQTVYLFNSAGDLTTITEPNGKVTTFAYSGANLTSITDPAGETTTFGYTNGMVTSITAPGGQTTLLSHDASGNLVQATLADGGVQTYGYNAVHQLVSSVDPAGETLTDTYDASGLIASMSNGAGGTVRVATPSDQYVLPTSQTFHLASAPTAPSPQALIDTITDANGNVTDATLNKAHEYVSGVDQQGPLETITRTGDLPSEYVDGDGNVQIVSYSTNQVSGGQDTVSLGALTSGSIAAPGDVNRYTFTGAAGETLDYEGLSATSGVTATLTDPSGAQVGDFYNPAANNGPFTLSTAGTYTLTFTSAATGSYSFEMVDLSQSTPLALNTPTRTTLSPALGGQFYQIAASAGERLEFTTINGGVGSWEAYSPAQGVLQSTGSTSSLQVTPSSAGPVYLVLQPGTTAGSFGFEVSAPTTSTQSLGLDTSETALVAGPGDILDYTFSGTAGQRIDWNLGTAAIVPQLLAPDGTVDSPSTVTGYSALLTLTETGTYTLQLTGQAAGSYPFEVSDVTSLPAATTGTLINGNLASSSATAVYAITGKAGQEIDVNDLSTSDITFTLFGVGNQKVGGNNPALDDYENVSQSFAATFPEDGTYVLALNQTTAGGATDYSFEVTNVTQPSVTPGGFDVWHSGSVASGKTASFTFTGVAGTPILLESQSGSSAADFVIPDQDPEAQPYQDVLYSEGDDGPVMLPYSGTYTVTVSGSNGSAASYDFEVLDLATDAKPLTLNSTTTGTLAANELAVYSFEGSPGQQLLYEAPNGFGAGSGDASVSLANLSSPFEGASLSGFGSGADDASTDTSFAIASAGTEYLILQNQKSTSSPYTFELQDFSTATPITANNAVSGMFSSTNTILYSISGTAGETLLFDDVSNTGEKGKFFGVVDYSTINWGSGDSQTLPHAGTYYFALVGPSNGSTPYTFEAVSPTINTYPITFGSEASGTIATLGQTDKYTFTAAAGEQLYLPGVYSTGSNYYATLTMTAPNGSTVNTYGIITLTQSGIYTVAVTGQVSTSYQFELLSVSAATPLSANIQVSGTLQYEDEAALYSFSGFAGQSVDFAANIYGETIYGPDGQSISTYFGSAVLQDTGTYIVALGNETNTTVNYTLDAEAIVQTNVSPLTLGTLYSNTLAAGDAQQFTFTGTAGQELLFENYNGNDQTETLTSSFGQTVYHQNVNSNDHLYLLPQTGMYTLSFANDNGGAYDFELVDEATSLAFTLGSPITGSLNPAGSSAVYRYQGRAGQTLAFNDSSDSSIEWSLISPLGQSIAGKYSGSILLPETGLYSLVFGSSASSGTPSYKLTITDASQGPVTNSGLNAAISGSLGAGQKTTYTFTASAGVPIYFDNADASSSPIDFTVNDPTNNAFLGSYANYSGGPRVLPDSGTYTVEIDNTGSASASYSFNVLDLNDAPAITPGTPVSGSLAAGLGVNVYQLNGSAGETLIANPAKASLTGVYVGMVDVTGSGTTEASKFPTEFTFPNSYPEYVLIQGTGAANTSYSFEFDTIASLPQFTSGAIFTNTTTTAYQLTGTAGERLYFPGGGEYGITLESSSGVTVSATQSNQNYNDAVVTLPSAGTYVLFPISAGEYGSSVFSIPAYIVQDDTKTLSIQNGNAGQQVQYDSTFQKPASITDGAGEQTLYQLDPKTSNVLSVTRVMSAGPNLVTSYTYNAAGQVTSMTDPNGNETAWTYDAFGRITRITHAVGTPLQASEEYTYDGAGNVLSYTDENSNVTQYQYDAMNRLVKVTDPLDNITSYTYNADGAMTSMTDPNGNVTTYAYNAAGERTSTTAPNGGVTRYEYDADGNVIEMIDPLGAVTKYRYDSRNRLIATTNELGGVTTQTYDAANNVKSMTDANGGTTTYAYDSRNRLVSETDPLGNTTTYQYDADNNLIATTAANGEVTTDVYDSAGRIIQAIDPLRNVTQYTYDGDGNQTSVTDPNGHTTTLAYDARNRLISRTDALGGVTKITYDADGNVLTTTDPRGNVTSFAYDADNHLTKTTDANGQVQTATYDADGNLTSRTNALGQTTTLTYDSLNHTKTMTDALGGVTTYSYNLDGNLAATTDSLGRTTTTVYDALQRPIATIDALGGRTSIVYDSDGNAIATTDPNGNTTRTSYDADGRLLSTTNALGGVITYKYDRVGNRISVTDPLGHTATYTFDADNRLLTTTNDLGGVTANAYNAGGQLTSATDALGNVTTYTYDADNRLSTITNALGGVTRKTYDANGNLTSMTDPNGNTTTYTYDKLNRLTTTTNALGGVTTRAYDARGNLTSVTDPNGNVTAYAYDGLNRLVKTTNALGGVVSETYDADGNLTSMTDPNGNTTTYAYDKLNRLMTRTNALSGVTSQTYDADGNLASVTDPNGNVTTYTYDALNRLAKTTNALGGITSETYDADGNLTSMTDPNGNTTTYAYDKLNRLTMITNALAGVTSRIYDADGNLASMTDPNGNVTMFAYDKLNRRIATTDALGGVTSRTYDADGNVISMTDPNGNVTMDAYDKLNRLIKTTNALGGVSSQTFDADGNVLTQTGPNGNTTTYTYDALNRLLTTQDPLGHTTSDAYDADGNLVSTTDANGNTTAYAYDKLNRIAKTTDAVGDVSTQTYDADGNTISFTDADGHTTTYAYDKLNRLTKTTNALGGFAARSYDADGNLTSSTDPLGQTTTYIYDALNRLLTTTDPLGFKTSRTYDADGNVLSRTDANGNVTTNSYDKLNRLVKTTDANGGATSETYDADGNLLTQTDPMGRTTTNAYDKLNRRTSITDPLGNATTRTYDADGNVLTSTDPNGNTTSYAYDADDRRVKTTDAAGGFATTAYDADGNVLSVVDPNGNTTSYTYDALNRQTSTTDPLGNTSKTTYDAVGNELTSTDPLGNVTTYTYDALNRQITVVDPRGGVTTYAYDADGKETSVTDPGGNTTSYTYDADNRIVKTTTPLGSATDSYDPNGDLTSRTDANGRTTDYTYDKLNRKTAEIWLNAQNQPVETISYGYDADGEQTSVSDANSAYQFTYDAVGRITSVSNSGTAGVPTVAMTYAYDKDGNELSRSDTINSQAADALNFAYNSLNEETQQTQSGPDVSSKRVNFTYDADGNVTGLNRYSDLAGTQSVANTTTTYDKDSRITAESNSAGSTTISAYTYTLDGDGRVTADTTPDGTDAYTYDKNAQLVADAATGSQANLSFSYDSNGNRTNAGYKTGPDNEVLSDGTFNYTYDAEGNLTSQTDIATGAVTLYSYDYRNRLTQIEYESSGSVLLEEINYTYDAFNNRIGETVTNFTGGAPTTTTEVFVYDGDKTAFTFDGGGNLTSSLLYDGPSQNQVLASDNGKGQALWALTDNLGTVRDVIDSSGAVQNHVSYDSFGDVTAQSNASLNFLYGYSGMQIDPASGLDYDRARFYDAALGRFLTQDPSGFTAGDVNLYRYVGNDPVTKTDPSGLCPATDDGEEQLIPADGQLDGPVNGQVIVDQNGNVSIPSSAPADQGGDTSNGYGNFPGGSGGGSGSGSGGTGYGGDGSGAGTGGSGSDQAGSGTGSGGGQDTGTGGSQNSGQGTGDNSGQSSGEGTGPSGNGGTGESGGQGTGGGTGQGNGEGTGESTGNGESNGDSSGSGNNPGDNQGQGDQNQGDGSTTTDKPLPDGTVEHITRDADGNITNITISSGVSEQSQPTQNTPNTPPPPSTGDTNTDFNNLMDWLGGAANGLKQGAEQGATAAYLATGALLGNTAAFLTDFGAAAIDQVETAWDPTAAARVNNDLAEAGYFTDNLGKFVSDLPGEIANAPAAAANAYNNYSNAVQNDIASGNFGQAGYDSLFGPSSNISNVVTGATLAAGATEGLGAGLSAAFGGEEDAALAALRNTASNEEELGSGSNNLGNGQNTGGNPEGGGNSGAGNNGGGNNGGGWDENGGGGGNGGNNGKGTSGPGEGPEEGNGRNESANGGDQGNSNDNPQNTSETNAGGSQDQSNSTGKTGNSAPPSNNSPPASVPNPFIGQGYPLALGLQDTSNGFEGVYDWAARKGFYDYNVGSPEGPYDVTINQITNAIDNAGTIHFNLDGPVDVTQYAGLGPNGQPLNGFTNYELNQIQQYSSYADKTVWYINDVPQPSTFWPEGLPDPRIK